MPTYDYKCSNCGHHFEVYQSMKDEKLKVCPNCGKESLTRLIGTGGGLIFKGSGFYLTDYKNKHAEKSAVKPAEETSKEKAVTPGDTGSKENKTIETKPQSSDSKKTSDKKES